MKTLFLIICFLFFGSMSFAQNQKTTIYCTISISGRVDYGDLGKLLPDSLKTSLLIDPRNSLNLRKVNHVLFYMLNSGWKMASIEADVTGGGMVTTSPSYLLTKEIYLDPTARSLFMQTYLTAKKEIKINVRCFSTDAELKCLPISGSSFARVLCFNNIFPVNSLEGDVIVIHKGVLNAVRHKALDLKTPAWQLFNV